MAIEKVLEETIITLPRDLALDEAKSLINYTAIQMHTNIHYHFSQNIVIRHPTSHGEFVKEEGTSIVKGEIISNVKPSVSLPFEFGNSEKNLSRLNSINFEFPSKWTEQYEQEEKQLLNDVRSSIENYFKEKTE
jgi:hypothetical protein